MAKRSLANGFIVTVSICFICAFIFMFQTQCISQTNKELANASGIAIKNLTNQKTENLTVLGKVWGFMKYYHPHILQGKYNWDSELFKIMPKLIEVQDMQKRSSLILNWINKFGKIDKEKASDDGTKYKDAKMTPDFKWLNDKKLFNDELIKKLNYIIANRGKGAPYYAIPAEGTGKPDFRNEEPYNGMRYPDDGFRLLALYRYWNIIQYFFPYKYAIGEDWNNVLPEFIPKFLNAKNETEYRLICLELITRINDTHANIWSDSVLEQYKGKYYAPVEVQFIENKPVITYLSKKYASKSKLKIGDIILKIADQDVNKIVQNKLYLTSASNMTTKLRNIAMDLLRGNSSEVKLTIERNNSTQVVMDERYIDDQLEPLNLYLEKTAVQWEAKCWAHINANTGYIYVGTAKNSNIYQIMKDLGNTKGLIIDLRQYPKEFIVYNLAQYLLERPEKFAKIAINYYDNPGCFNWLPVLEIGVENKDYYKGKIVILINEGTQSQGEFMAMALRTAKNAVVIGSQTAGADGDISLFALPGCIFTSMSGIGVYYPDGKETQRIGIVPDIEVTPTIKGIKEGRDELLETAIHIIEK